MSPEEFRNACQSQIGNSCVPSHTCLAAASPSWLLTTCACRGFAVALGENLEEYSEDLIQYEGQLWKVQRELEMLSTEKEKQRKQEQVAKLERNVQLLKDSICMANNSKKVLQEAANDNDPQPMPAGVYAFPMHVVLAASAASQFQAFVP